MAETMEQYMSKTRVDYGSGIARPKIDGKDSFELKGQFLKELRDNTFSGAIPSKTDADAKVSIQEMAEYSQKWHNGTSRTRKGDEKVYAAQVGCEQCKGPHYTKDCPLKEEGKTLEESYYTQFGRPFQGGGYRAAAPGFYQRNNANPSYQERRQSMEETLTLIKSLEIQIGKISKVLQERGFGSLPSSTEANLRDHVKSILTTAEADSNSIRPIGSSQYALKRDQVDGLMPTIEEENMDGYQDQDMGDIILGKPFCKASCVEARTFVELILTLSVDGTYFSS
ncbi:DNA-directed DNA polymerase [Tanacetum coccineum]